jgi:hypothetical protein
MSAVSSTPSLPTPGPWDWDDQFIVAPDPRGLHSDIYIAEIVETDEEDRAASPEQQEANKRLIAAAPELLGALECLCNLIHDDESSLKKGYIKFALKRAEQLIAQVRG